MNPAPRTLWIPIALVAASAALLSCSSSGKCVSGASAACSCTDGRMGAQTCNASGSFESCVCGATPAGGDGGVADGAVAATPTAVDLLFMIDNSPGTGPQQMHLARAVPALSAELRKAPGGPPNLHVGIISSDLGAGDTTTYGGCQRVGGDRAILQDRPPCGLSGGQPWFELDGGWTHTNFVGDFDAVFSCAVMLGVAGCGFEQQLGAVVQALDTVRTPQNAGFLRPDAQLVIALLTDEDDCSALPGSGFYASTGGDASRCTAYASADGGGKLVPVADLARAVKAAKTDPARVLVTRVAWPIATAPGCTSVAPGSPAPPTRIGAFLAEFGDRGIQIGACENDYSSAMTQLGQLVVAALAKR